MELPWIIPPSLSKLILWVNHIRHLDGLGKATNNVRIIRKAMQSLLKEVSMLVLCAVTGRGWQETTYPGQQDFPDFHEPMMEPLGRFERASGLEIQTLIFGP